MTATYDKHNLFYAKIKERYCLNSSNSSKKTYHIVIDLTGSNIQYKVGDSLAILPSNDIDLVNLLLSKLKCSGKELVLNKKNETVSLFNFLAFQANLSKVNRKILEFFCTKSSSYQHYLLPENKEFLISFLDEIEIVDLFADYEFSLDYQEFCNLLLPLLPRFYSIASSMKIVGNEAHLTVGLTEYYKNTHLKKGVCSHFLCETAPLMDPVIPLYLQPSHEFTLPIESNNKPIIMVGPGTGIAPFRGFMQERISRQNISKNWLFFGERNRSNDYFYEEYWRKLQENGLLKIDLAFSRDQQNKIYVQDKMRENARELWQWLEQGAYLFVCGDASKMAKDVDQTLREIIQIEGNKDPIEVKNYLKMLKEQKRYLRDVY